MMKRSIDPHAWRIFFYIEGISRRPQTGIPQVDGEFSDVGHATGNALESAAMYLGDAGWIWEEIMNALTILKPMLVFAGERCVAWFAALLLAMLPAIALGDKACPGIHVKILNIRNSTGTVACALFESPTGFPTEYLHFATNIMVIKIRATQARCDFEDIPAGQYALAVIHDENMNGKLETNLIGIPTEGYGFSNDAKALLGAPTFSAASFAHDGQNLDMTISLHY